MGGPGRHPGAQGQLDQRRSRPRDPDPSCRATPGPGRGKARRRQGEYRSGDDPNAITQSAKRGESLFFSERLECFHCHGGFNFTGSVDYLGKGFAEVEFHNTGLYNLKDKFSYPEPNVGLYEFTQQDEDVGKFKAPTLRNIALTAPYMHDGSVATLEDAIEHYRLGGRTVKSGPNAGVGFDNPNKSEFVKSFELTAAERADLLAFLRSLTDRNVLTDRSLSDPGDRPQLPRLPRHSRRSMSFAAKSSRSISTTARFYVPRRGAGLHESDAPAVCHGISRTQ